MSQKPNSPRGPSAADIAAMKTGAKQRAKKILELCAEDLVSLRESYLVALAEQPEDVRIDEVRTIADRAGVTLRHLSNPPGTLKRRK